MPRTLADGDDVLWDDEQQARQLKFHPVSLNTLATSPVSMPFALASFTFISIGSFALSLA